MTRMQPRRTGACRRRRGEWNVIKLRRSLIGEKQTPHSQTDRSRMGDSSDTHNYASNLRGRFRFRSSVPRLSVVEEHPTEGRLRLRKRDRAFQRQWQFKQDGISEEYQALVAEHVGLFTKRSMRARAARFANPESCCGYRSQSPVRTCHYRARRDGTHPLTFHVSLRKRSLFADYSLQLSPSHGRQPHPWGRWAASE